MKPRKVNSWGVRCSEPTCGVFIPAGDGYYLGKRGKNREDYYLCQSCDTRRKMVEAQRKLNLQAMEEQAKNLANKRAERLHKKTEGGSCDCI